MSLPNLFFTGCFEPLTPAQQVAVENVIGGGEVVDKSCHRLDLNTCGMDVSELINTYEFFSNEKGLYKTWGGIKFPWEISPSTPGLDASNTDDRWSAGIYKSSISYPTGSKILHIEDDGYVLGVYEANKNTTSTSFDPDDWDKICEVRSSTPVGVQSLETLKSLYKQYSLDQYKTSWGESDSSWDLALSELSAELCSTDFSSVKDFENCIGKSNSDRWKSYRIKKDYFYRAEDIVLVEGECGDSFCLWLATQDMPATDEVYAEYKNFKSGIYWSKIYCVNSGYNKCLEYKRIKEPELAYDVVQIGSMGHYVEAPRPYSIGYDKPLLNSSAEIKPPPATLSVEQIREIESRWSNG